MIVHPMDIIIPEKLLQAHNNGFHHAMTSGEMKYVNKVLTTRAVHKDGSTMYVDMSFGMVRDANDKILGAMAIARDRSEEHTSELQSLMRISYAVFCLNKKTSAANHQQMYNLIQTTHNKPQTNTQQ